MAKKKENPKHLISLTQYAHDKGIQKFVIPSLRVWLTKEKGMKNNTRTKIEWEKLYKQYLKS